jgi:hypothetical protein
MSTREIPRDEWNSFFDSFSLRHQGWLVTVEVLGSDIGAQVEAKQMPLEGISADLKRSGEDIISIFIGGKPQEHVTHTIHAPERVRLKETEDGADEVLEIESESLTTLMRLRSAVLPEMVDGIL